MPKEQSPGKPTTRRYSPEENAAAVREETARAAVIEFRAEVVEEPQLFFGRWLTQLPTGHSSALTN